MSFIFSAALRPANCVGWVTTSPCGRAGWSAHTASMGLEVTATKAAPAASQASRRRLAWSAVTSHGSKPSRSPFLRFFAIHDAGGFSIRWKGAKIFSSTCWRTWITYRPSTKIAAFLSVTMATPALPRKLVSQRRRSA